MNNSVSMYVSGLNRRNFTNNTQRVLYTLLTAPGDGWVSRGSFRVGSAAARVRDLRKSDYGSFDVVCQSSVQLGRTSKTTFYRLNTGRMTLSQLRSVFEGV